MTLQTSGAISFSQIENEFGVANPRSLSKYYGFDSGIPSSGPIKFSQFYGKIINATRTIGAATNFNARNDFPNASIVGGLKSATTVYNNNQAVKYYLNVNGIVNSTDTSSYAFDTGGFPGGSSLYLTNNSYIVGAGGAGGNGGAGGANGGNGGNALLLRLTTYITNNGVLGGGGGGGGGGGDQSNTQCQQDGCCHQTCYSAYAYGGGGGGGAGSAGGSGGSSSGNSGGDGSLLSGGGGGSGYYSSAGGYLAQVQSGNGGNGGNLGQAGNSGTGDPISGNAGNYVYYAGGAGGSPGNYIVNGGYAIWFAYGTLLGGAA